MNKFQYLMNTLRELSISFIAAVIPTFLVCCLPWGSYGWMGSLDFKKLDYEEASKRFVELKFPQDMTLNGKKIAAGTDMKVIGLYQTLPEKYDKGSWLVETPEGERGLLHRKYLDKLTNEPTVLVYNHARSEDIIKFHPIVDKSIIDALVIDGVSFEDFDKRFGPSTDVRIDTETGKKIAVYDGLDYCYDGDVDHGLKATFSEGRLESATYYRPDDTWCPDFIAPYADKWMRNSLAFFPAGYYEPSNGYGFLQSSFYPHLWLARGVMGVFDVLFAFLVAAIVNTIVLLMFADDKTKSNAFIGWIVFACLAAAYTPYCYFTMEFSPNLFCFVATTISMLIVSTMFENRCSNCHALVEMEITGKTFGNVVTDVYDSNHSKDRHVKTRDINHGYEEVVDREYYTKTTEFDKRNVTTAYRCPNCGYRFKSTITEITGMRNRKRTTGVDRITTTTTFK